MVDEPAPVTVEEDSAEGGDLPVGGGDMPAGGGVLQGGALAKVFPKRNTLAALAIQGVRQILLEVHSEIAMLFQNCIPE